MKKRIAFLTNLLKQNIKSFVVVITTDPGIKIKVSTRRVLTLPSGHFNNNKEGLITKVTNTQPQNPISFLFSLLLTANCGKGRNHNKIKE